MFVAPFLSTQHISQNALGAGGMLFLCECLGPQILFNSKRVG